MGTYKRRRDRAAKAVAVERKKTRRRFRKEYTFSDVLSEAIDEVERSLGIIVYKHKTELSPEQIIFALEFINNGYKAEPAVRETFGNLADKWSRSQCATVAKELLQMEKIQEFIREQLALRVEKLKTTSDWVAQRYRDWATINVADYIKVQYTDEGRPYITLSKDLDKLPDSVRSAIRCIKVNKEGSLEVTFVDQKAALDSLTKLLGFMNEKLDVNVKSNVSLSFDAQDAEA